MKHLLIIISLLLPFHLLGFNFKSSSADYEVSYGIVGVVGLVHAQLRVENSTYKVRIKAEGKGLIKFLSRNRIEVYESTGIIKNGHFVPNLFVKNRIWGSKEERKRYFFNHDIKEGMVVATHVDGNKLTESREKLPYYSDNDILTLFFNLESLIGKNLSPKKQVVLSAVGANKKDGHLTIQTPEKVLKSEIEKLLQREDTLLAVVLNQKLFFSKNGELFINIREDGICDRVMLKDVLMYGDVIGRMKNFKFEK